MNPPGPSSSRPPTSGGGPGLPSSHYGYGNPRLQVVRPQGHHPRLQNHHHPPYPTSRPSLVTSSGPSTSMSQPQPVVIGNRPAGAAMVNRAGLMGGAQQAMAAAGQQPIIMNQQQVMRVQAPGQVHPGIRPGALASSVAQGRNIVINQPGMRPGTPGSQISVPLSTLQDLQPGQGIPTGQAGHLLVKTENGQYQILRMGSSSAPTAAARTVTTVSAAGAAGQQVPQGIRQAIPQQRPMLATQQAGVRPTAAPSAGSPGGAIRPAASGGGRGQQMAPETAKVKCKNFLATLLRLASEQPPNVANNVRNLIQGLIDGNVEPDIFTTKLQSELNSSPQPCLVPFLKNSLPFLQRSLLAGELTIDGVRAPGAGTPGSMVGNPAAAAAAAQPQSHLGSAVRHQRPQHVIQQRTMTPQVATGMPGMVRTMQTNSLPGMAPRPGPSSVQSIHHQSPSIAKTAPSVALAHQNKMRPMGAQGIGIAGLAQQHQQKQQQLGMHPSGPAGLKKEKTSGTFSTAGDDDITDVAVMGGVNLAEESQRMQGATDLIGTQIRSCKDETFLQTGLLHRRIAKICRDRGLEDPSPEVIALMSHATQARLKTLLEKLSVVAEHRMDVVKLEGDHYEVIQDVKGQLKFLSDLDKIEKKRHEEAERELLLRAAKSRTKTEDPEKEKLKAKAKEMQRLEEEQLRHEKANNTALLAIGGPKKRLKLDGSDGGFVMGGFGKGPTSSAMANKPRPKRVNMRDLMFLMEQEKELKRSRFLWKAYT